MGFGEFSFIPIPAWALGFILVACAIGVIFRAFGEQARELGFFPALAIFMTEACFVPVAIISAMTIGWWTIGVCLAWCIVNVNLANFVRSRFQKCDR